MSILKECQDGRCCTGGWDYLCCQPWCQELHHQLKLQCGSRGQGRQV